MVLFCFVLPWWHLKCCAESWLECPQRRRPSTAGTPCSRPPHRPALAVRSTKCTCESSEMAVTASAACAGCPRAWGGPVTGRHVPRAGSPMSLLAAGTPLSIGGHAELLSSSSPPTGFWKQTSYFGLDFSILFILKSQFVSDLWVSMGERCMGTVKPLQGRNLQR